jgi:vacuolar protein sorting-associated protein 16
MDDQLTLFQVQMELDKKKGEKYFLGLTMTKTLEKLFETGQKDKADKFKHQFSLSDKNYYWIAVKTYCRNGFWELLSDLSSKGSPIGFTPFVLECLKYNNVSDAKKYFLKVTDVNDKVELLCEMGEFNDAVNLAWSKKDPQLLNFIKNRTNDKNIKSTIQNYMIKLGY